MISQSGRAFNCSKAHERMNGSRRWGIGREDPKKTRCRAHESPGRGTRRVTGHPARLPTLTFYKSKEPPAESVVFSRNVLSVSKRYAAQRHSRSALPHFARTHTAAVDCCCNRTDSALTKTQDHPAAMPHYAAGRIFQNLVLPHGVAHKVRVLLVTCAHLCRLGRRRGDARWKLDHAPRDGDPAYAVCGRSPRQEAAERAERRVTATFIEQAPCRVSHSCAILSAPDTVGAAPPA